MIVGDITTTGDDAIRNETVLNPCGNSLAHAQPSDVHEDSMLNLLGNPSAFFRKCPGCPDRSKSSDELNRLRLRCCLEAGLAP